MVQRGRKSVAAITTLPAVNVAQSRLQPPDHMPVEVKDVFSELVFSVPPEHFRPCDTALVEQYAQSIVLSRLAYSELQLTGVVSAEGKNWLVALEKAHRSSVALAARLRLCPQSRLSAKAADREKPPSSYKIWEDFD
jgi:hypothetical protein